MATIARGAGSGTSVVDRLWIRINLPARANVRQNSVAHKDATARIHSVYGLAYAYFGPPHRRHNDVPIQVYADAIRTPSSNLEMSPAGGGKKAFSSRPTVLTGDDYPADGAPGPWGHKCDCKPDECEILCKDAEHPKFRYNGDESQCECN